jgi:cyclic-di-GMP phosphodiesterase TipF (flagellum assembly factor)
MSKTLQFIYFVCYGLAGLAIAYLAPKIFPDTPLSVAWLAGAVVFLAGALLHETASRCYHASLDRRRLALLHRAYQEATEEIDRLAADVHRLTHGDTYYAEVEPPAAPEETAVRPRAPEFRAPEQEPPAPRREPSAMIPDDPSAVVERPLDPPPPKPPVRRPAGQPDRAGPAADALASEVKLLHGLVQRLYAGGMPERGADDLTAGGKTGVVLGSLMEREILNSVRDALRHGNVELHLQPIVTLPPRKPKHFDCALRIVSDRGDALTPAQYGPVLRDNKLTQAADGMLLFRTVQLVAKARTSEPGSYYFCRVPAACLSDRGFFDDFLSYLKDAEDLVSCVAFEVRETELMDLDDAAADVLGSLVDLGFHLCIDGLRNFDVDAMQLAEGGVRFVKMETATLMPAITDDAQAGRLRRLKANLDAAGIDLVVTSIANEQLLVELLDFDIELGQGPLFGEARKIRDARAPTAEGRRERM